MRCLANLIRLVQILAVFGIGQNQLGYVLAPVSQRNVKHIIAVLFDLNNKQYLFYIYEQIFKLLCLWVTLCCRCSAAR